MCYLYSSHVLYMSIRCLKSKSYVCLCSLHILSHSSILPSRREKFQIYRNKWIGSRAMNFHWIGTLLEEGLDTFIVLYKHHLQPIGVTNVMITTCERLEMFLKYRDLRAMSIYHRDKCAMQPWSRHSCLILIQWALFDFLFFTNSPVWEVTRHFVAI